MKNKTARIFLAIIVIAVFIVIYLSFRSHFSTSLRDNKTINILFLITSENKTSKELQLLYFLNYVPAKQYFNIIPIPVDTRTSVAENKTTTLDKLFETSWNKDKNVHIASNEIKKSVENIFQNMTNIPYYVAVDKQHLMKFINSAGGIRIDINEPLIRKDASGIYMIYLATGNQCLNGQNSVEYLSLKRDYKDFSGALRTQALFKSFLQKFTNPLLGSKISYNILKFYPAIESNLSGWDIAFGLVELKDLKISDVQVFQLPGTFRKNYFEPDEINIKGLSNRLFPSKDSAVSMGPKIRIEVWNASGKNNLAEKVTWILREKGYDVVEFGTFSVNQKKTLIKDLSGDSKTAQKITEIISCGETIVKYDAKRYVDISLILGEDCEIEPKTE